MPGSSNSTKLKQGKVKIDDDGKALMILNTPNLTGKNHFLWFYGRPGFFFTHDINESRKKVIVLWSDHVIN